MQVNPTCFTCSINGDSLVLISTLFLSTCHPEYVQDPNLRSHCWSSNGNQVMSILHVDLKRHHIRTFIQHFFLHLNSYLTNSSKFKLVIAVARRLEIIGVIIWLQ